MDSTARASALNLSLSRQLSGLTVGRAFVANRDGPAGRYRVIVSRCPAYRSAQVACLGARTVTGILPPSVRPSARRRPHAASCLIFFAAHDGIGERPLFLAPFTLWLSTIAVVRLISSRASSRAAYRAHGGMRSRVPSQL